MFKLITNPYKYQVEGGKFLLSTRYAYLADEMGLGKSIQALFAVCELRIKTLIVCPAYLCINWREEFEKHTSIKAKIWSHHKGTIDPDIEAYIIGYPQLKHAKELFKWANCVVADEAQYLKNVESQRTEIFHTYIEEFNPEYLFLLSGTPIDNKVPDLHSPLLLLAKDKYNAHRITYKYESHFLFCHRFTNIKQSGGKVVYTGRKNVEELKSYMKGRFLRRKANEVLDLPDVVVSNKIVSYDENPQMLQEFQNYLVNDRIDCKFKRESAIAKSHFTAELVKEMFESDVGPVVIFSDHPEALYNIQRLLHTKTLGIIDGSVPVEKRPELVHKFQAGKLDGLLITIPVAVGFNLTRGNRVVFNDINWRNSFNEQAWKRLHRIGQNQRVFIDYVTGFQFDRTIRTCVEGKRTTSEEVLKDLK